MQTRFWKYEGAGNDFVMLDMRGGLGGNLDGDVVRRLCDRRRGVGGDGLLALLDGDEGYDFRMRYFNADGSEAAMCGNGARCIALFARDLGAVGHSMRFVGADSEHRAEILSDGEVRVSMRDVEVCTPLGNASFMLDTGVPHYVEFTDDVDALDVFHLGRLLRDDKRFATLGGVNVNFAQVLPDGSLKLRTYERGVEDETLACGTGAVAATIAAHVWKGGLRTSVLVHVRGGELRVQFEAVNNHSFRNIVLSGPARRVFEGVINIQA
ncbi:MAG: diaminopimelate epimerase [Rikenellaceae bacterium]|nr:diaminopimelate epimerase [Rikenellaceae bacterium]MCL2693312.1 diaminopimelate epimerase [Rikenellaceae bacterium]